MDKRQWSTEVDDKNSLCTDFYFPLVKQMLHQEGLPIQTTDLNEVTQLVMWAVLLLATTKTKMHDVFAEVFNTARQAWKQGRTARRAVLERCMQIAKSAKPSPVSKDALDSHVQDLFITAADHYLLDMVVDAL